MLIREAVTVLSAGVWTLSGAAQVLDRLRRRDPESMNAIEALPDGASADLIIGALRAAGPVTSQRVMKCNAPSQLARAWRLRGHGRTWRNEECRRHLHWRSCNGLNRLCAHAS
jgi:hypothetical protein